MFISKETYSQLSKMWYSEVYDMLPKFFTALVQTKLKQKWKWLFKTDKLLEFLSKSNRAEKILRNYIEWRDPYTVVIYKVPLNWTIVWCSWILKEDTERFSELDISKKDINYYAKELFTSDKVAITTSKWTLFNVIVLSKLSYRWNYNFNPKLWVFYERIQKTVKSNDPEDEAEAIWEALAELASILLEIEQWDN